MFPDGSKTTGCRRRSPWSRREKITARVRLVCNKFGLPLTPRHDVIDLEGDADAQQQRQRDDIGEIERHADQDHDLHRHHAREQPAGPASAPRRAASGAPAAGSRRWRPSASAPASRKAPTMVSPASSTETGPRIGVRLDLQHGPREHTQLVGIAGIVLGRDRDARAAVRPRSSRARECRAGSPASPPARATPCADWRSRRPADRPSPPAPRRVSRARPGERLQAPPRDAAPRRRRSFARRSAEHRPPRLGGRPPPSAPRRSR